MILCFYTGSSAPANVGDISDAAPVGTAPEGSPMEGLNVQTSPDSGSGRGSLLSQLERPRFGQGRGDLLLRYKFDSPVVVGHPVASGPDSCQSPMTTGDV